MPADYRSGSLVPPRPGVPFERHFSVLSNLCKADCAARSRAEKAAKASSRVSEAYRAEVQAIFGKKKCADWLAFLAKERASFGKAALALKKPGSSPALERLRKESYKKNVAYLGKLGVDPRALLEARMGASKDLAKLHAGATGQKKSRGKLMHPDDVPKHVKEHWKNPLTWYGPNLDRHYEGWNWSLYWSEWYAAPAEYGGRVYSTGTNPDPFAIDSALGQVDTHNELAYYAGIGDHYHQEIYASVGFWYTMNATGPLKAFATMWPLLSNHSLSWVDVSGSSGVEVRQTAEVTLKVTGSRPQDDVDDFLGVHDTHWAWWDGETDGSQDIRMVEPWDTGSLAEAGLARGGSIVAELMSEQVFGIGEPVWVQIGTRTVNDVMADLLHADSTMNYRWFIQEVGVEAAGS